MGKYIDADKLISEVKALKRRKGFLSFENTEITEAYMARGVQFTCDDVVNLIQSLQQEQPDFPTTDEEIERLLATHPKIEVPNKYKTPDWLWKKQEQPDLPSDLEEKSEKPNKFEDELKDYLRRYYNCDYPMQIEENTCSPTMPHIVEAARHFAKWGAEWQAKQDQETIELAEDHAYLAGAVNEREKMMKEAVEGYVTLTLTGVRTVAATIKGEDNIGPGDKVRVIVLKED